MSPGSLQRLLREYDRQNISNIDHFSSLKIDQQDKNTYYQNQKKLKKITWVFYLNEMFNLVIRKHSKYLNSELNYTLFSDFFLRDNGLSAYANFLDQCSKDIDFKDDGELECQEINWKKYLPFLDAQYEEEKIIDGKKHTQKPSANFLHTKDEYIESLKENEKDHGQIIKEVYEFVSKLLKKTLFGQFIEEYGELLLPNLFIFLSTYEKQYKHSQKDINLSKILSYNRSNLIEIEFVMKGRKTDFQISRKNQFQKGTDQKTTEEPVSEKEKGRSKTHSQSKKQEKEITEQKKSKQKYQVEASITAKEPINIYMTNRSLCMLMEFIQYSFDENNQFLKGKEKCYNTEYQQLLNCLQNYGDITDLCKEQKIQMRDKTFEVRLERISLKIYNENMYFQNVGELKLQFSNILVKTIDPSDQLFEGNQLDLLKQNHNINPSSSIPQEFKNSQKQTKLMNNTQYYRCLLIQLNSITLTHNEKQLDIYNSIEKLNNINNYEKKGHFLIKKGKDFKIFETSINVCFMNCYIQNYPTLTDKKLYIHMPFLKIQFSDQLYSLFSLINLLGLQNIKKQSDLIKQNKVTIEQNQQDQITIKEFEKFYQQGELFNELDLIVQKHSKDSVLKGNGCKHCFIKYKKSKILVNFVLGNFLQYFQRNSLFDTYFNVLQNLYDQQTKKRNIFGFSMQLLSSDWITKSQKKNKQKDHQEESDDSKLNFQEEPNSQDNSYQSVNKEDNLQLTEISIPFILITYDSGYFKENLMVHSSATENTQENLKEEEIVDSKNSQFNIIPYWQLQTEELKTELLNSLDDIFFLYCEQKELSISEKNNQNSSDNNQKKKKSSHSLQPLYFVCMSKKNRNQFLQIQYDKTIKDNQLYDKFFMKLQTFEINFQNPYNISSVITIMRNIKYLFKKLTQQHESIYDPETNYKEAKQVVQEFFSDEIPIQKQLKQFIDSQIILFQIDNLGVYIQNIQVDRDKGDKHFINFTCKEFQITHNLNILSSRKFLCLFHNSEKLQLMKVDKLQLNFSNKVSCIIREVGITREGMIITCIVRKIVIKRKLFQEKLKEVEINYLFQIPNKNSKQTNEAFNIVINFEQNGKNNLMKTNIKFSPILMCLSQENMNEILYCINYLDTIQSQEFREFIRYTKNNLFLNNNQHNSNIQNDIDAQTTLEMQEFNQSHQSIQESNISARTMELEFELERFIVLLSKDETIFSKFEITNITVNLGLNNEIDAKIQNITFNPHPIYNGVKQSTILVPGIYSNLIRKMPPVGLKHRSAPLSQPLLKFTNNIKDRSIKLEIDNMEFIFLNIYIQELLSFQLSLEKNLINTNQRLLANLKPATQQERVEEFQQNKQNKIQIIILNSKILIPSDSKSENQVSVNFEQCHVDIIKAVNEMNIPHLASIDTKDIVNQKFIVDMAQESEKEQQICNKISAKLQNICVKYKINKSEQNFLQNKEIDVHLISPCFRSQSMLDINWIQGPKIVVNVNNLSMKMDLGRLMKSKLILQQNMEEKSSIFEFKQSSLQKINLKINNMVSDVSVEKFKKKQNDEKEVEIQQSNFNKSNILNKTVQSISDDIVFSQAEDCEDNSFMTVKGD